MPNVKVLLNEKVEKLGDLGEIVSVKPGYARNYLLPQRLATIPTSGEVKRIQKRKELLQKQYEEEKAKAEDIAKKLAKTGDIEIIRKAGDAGKLFGAVTSKDIVEKIKDHTGIEISKKQLLLKRSISEIGETIIKIKLHTEVAAQVKIVIKAEE